jgi:hypothetical protein
MTSSISHIHQLQTKGFTVFQNAIPKSTITALREHVRRGVLARPEAFLEIANPADVLNQEVKQEDPRMTALKRKFATLKQRRKKLIQQRRAEARANHSRRDPAKRPGEDDDAFRFRTTEAASATAADIARLSQRITQQLAQLDPSDSRIRNDPQRLKAIDEHRCNVWMCEADTIGRRFLRGDFGRALGEIAMQLGSGGGGGPPGGVGVRDPVLFCDRPLFQLPYGRPTLMHFAAPFFGLEQVRGSECISSSSSSFSEEGKMTGKKRMNAISLWVPLEEPLAPTEENLKNFSHMNNSNKNNNSASTPGMTRRRARLAQENQNSSSSTASSPLELLPTPIRVIEGSHHIVREHLLRDPKRFDMRLFRNDFNAVDSSIALWLRRFPDLSPTPPHVAELLDKKNNTNTALAISSSSPFRPVNAVELEDIRPGTVVAFDPFTFCGLGANVSAHSQCVLQFLIASSNPEDAAPSVHPYSWIRDWKATSLKVDLKNDIVFPKLF